MDDLSQQLQSILSDPQTMGRLQGLLSSLGKDQGEASAEPCRPGGAGPFRAAGSSGGWAGLQAAGKRRRDRADGLKPPSPVPDDQAGAPFKPGQPGGRRHPAFAALRPLLSEGRQKKVDEAIQILQMLRLLPLLKESGSFSGLLSGLL